MIPSSPMCSPPQHDIRSTLGPSVRGSAAKVPIRVLPPCEGPVTS